MAAELKFPLAFNDKSEMVEELGMSLPSMSLPTEVARSSGSGWSSVSLASPSSIEVCLACCCGEIDIPPLSSCARDLVSNDFSFGERRSWADSKDKSPNLVRMLFVE